MFATIWAILKNFLGFVRDHGAVFAAVVITAVVVAFGTWHIKPGKPGVATTVTVDTASIVKVAVDSTRIAVTGQYTSTVNYWRHRYITKPGRDGKPETTSIIDTGSYNQESFWEQAYYQVNHERDSLRLILAEHKEEPVPPAPGHALGIGILLDHTVSVPGLKNHETAATGLIQYHNLLLAPRAEYSWYGDERLRAGAGLGFMW
jgi:hypothetical protein